MWKKEVVHLRRMKKIVVFFMLIYLLLLVQIHFDYDFSPLVNSRFFSKIPEVFVILTGLLGKYVG